MPKFDASTGDMFLPLGDTQEPASFLLAVWSMHWEKC